MKKLIVALALLLPFLATTGAWAHVSVTSNDAEPGAEVAVLTFNVPTESDTASTTKLAVQLPDFDTVTAAPIAGWTSKLVKTGDKVTSVEWSAQDGGIAPGQFGEFAVRVGPLPNASEVSFGALQTYSDGTTVAWNESAAPGSDAEPEHPKPTLTLTAAQQGSEKTSTTGPTVLSIIALVVAATALGLAVVGNARRKKA